MEYKHRRVTKRTNRRVIREQLNQWALTGDERAEDVIMALAETERFVPGARRDDMEASNEQDNRR